jgi:hypothetical protein
MNWCAKTNACSPNGFYAEVTVSYDGIIAQQSSGRPFRIDSLRPIQMSKSDVWTCWQGAGKVHDCRVEGSARRNQFETPGQHERQCRQQAALQIGGGKEFGSPSATLRRTEMRPFTRYARKPLSLGLVRQISELAFGGGGGITTLSFELILG